MSDSLFPRHEAFISEFLKDGNASAAAQRAGFSPRSVSKLLAIPGVAEEIARRQTAIAHETNVTVKGLIAETENARLIAEGADNANAMVAAIQLKAKLSGLINAEPQPADAPANVSKRDLARTVVNILRDAAVEEGATLAVASRGESLLRVRDTALAKAVMPDAEPAQTLDEALGDEATPAAPERIAVGLWGYAIELRHDGVRGRPRWSILDPDGVVCGHAPTQDEATAQCKALREARSVGAVAGAGPDMDARDNRRDNLLRPNSGFSGVVKTARGEQRIRRR
jgi:phage terminase small subunit